MSKENPSPRSVIVAFTSANVGSALSAIISGSIAQVVPSFFLQALPSNTGYIQLGIASTVSQMSAQVGSALVGSNSIVSLDSGQSVSMKASEWSEYRAMLRFEDFIISASVTADQAVISFFV